MYKGEAQMSDKGKQIMAVKKEIGGDRRKLPRFVDMNVWLGGNFVFKNWKTTYEGGCMVMKPDLAVAELSASCLREHVLHSQRLSGMRITGHFRMWFIKQHGRNLTNGRRKIVVDADVVGFLESMDANDRLILYVVDVDIPTQPMSLPSFRTKSASFVPGRPLTQFSQLIQGHLDQAIQQAQQPKQPKNSPIPHTTTTEPRQAAGLNTLIKNRIERNKQVPKTPIRKSPRQPQVILEGTSKQTENSSQTISTATTKPKLPYQFHSQTDTPKTASPTQAEPHQSQTQPPDNQTQHLTSAARASAPTPSPKHTPRRKHVARKKKVNKNKGKEKVDENEAKENGKRKKKGRRGCLVL